MTSFQQPQQTLTEVEKEAIKKDVKDQFSRVVSALNNIDASAWSEYYSKDEFLSAIVSTDCYASRSACHVAGEPARGGCDHIFN